jgi:hypothetical protein
VVDQFRDALASGKRIRWLRFKPVLSPEQEELQMLRDWMEQARFHREWLPKDVEKARKSAAELPKLERMLEAMRRDVVEWERRIAELEAQGVTLPPVSDADFRERRTARAAKLWGMAKRLLSAGQTEAG